MKLLSADRPIPNLIRGREIRSNLALSADVCIVGSGPGGAIAAARLAASGARVILLEEGSSFTRKSDFHMQESEAYPKLYQDHGNRATDDLAITILQGRGVGGGTLVNWTTCFRTPESTLALWRERFGLAEFTRPTGRRCAKRCASRYASSSPPERARFGRSTRTPS